MALHKIIAFVALATICDLAFAANEYLPPSKGYNYDKPQIPFPSGDNQQQVPYPRPPAPRPTAPRPPAPRPQQPTYQPPRPSYQPPSVPSYQPPSVPPYQPPRPTPPAPSYKPPVQPPTSYNPPPKPTYGPPQPKPTYGTPQPSDHHHEHHEDHHHHEPGMPFDFAYAVKDDYYGTDYAHNAVSDGDQVKGEYRVALPDGRLQVVRYVADWKTGFNAEVSYQGEPKYPDQPQGAATGGGGYKY